MKLLLSKAEKKRYYRRLRIKIYCSAGLAILAAVLFFYTLLNWQVFKIKEIHAEGAVKLEDARPLVLQKPLARFLGLNNFFSWPGKIGDWQIEKDYSSGILKILGPKLERFAIWCSRECYWVTADGVAVEEAPDTEGTSIAKVMDARNSPILTGRGVTEQGIFNRIASVIAAMGDLPLRIKNYEFNDKRQELAAEGARGERMIFSVRFAPSGKLFDSLLALIKNGELRRSEYADFTVENRIYLKPR